MLFIIDTCQAESMHSQFRSPEIFSIASSKIGESSYSYTVDTEIGLSIMDRFSHQLFEFLQASQSQTTLQQLLDHFDPTFLAASTVIRSDLFSRPAGEVLISEFFSGKQENQQLRKYPIEGKAGFIWKSASNLQSTASTAKWNRNSFTIAINETDASSFLSKWLVTLSIVALLLKGFLSKPNEKVRK